MKVVYLLSQPESQQPICQPRRRTLYRVSESALHTFSLSHYTVVSAEISSSCLQQSVRPQLGKTAIVAAICSSVWSGAAADTCVATRHRPGDSILYCQILPYKSINTQTVNTKQFEKGDQTNKRGISATVAAPRLFCEGSWEYHISNNFVQVSKTHSNPAGNASGADSTFNGQFK